MKQTLNRITHVNIVVDASWSMEGHEDNLIKVVDSQIEHLAERSRQLDQDIHISVYDFADDVRCLIYDRDVLRLPSIAKLYQPRGRTALIDATLQALAELAQTAQLHGEHAFLTFVITDGQNNINSSRAPQLRARLDSLPKNWTVACLVPDAMGRDDAMAYGFAPDNIAIWNPSGRRGVEEAGEVISRATDSFLDGRAKGVVGTRSLFSTGVEAVNAQTVRAALKPLNPDTYQLLPVGSKNTDIRLFFAGQPVKFKIGSNFYQLTERVLIQKTKEIAIRERSTGKIYGGPGARDLLGLRNENVKVAPDYNPDFDVFVQSTSPNRVLKANTDLLVLKQAA
jgi:hypothetical protein